MSELARKKEEEVRIKSVRIQIVAVLFSYFKSIFRLQIYSLVVSHVPLLLLNKVLTKSDFVFGA